MRRTVDLTLLASVPVLTVRAIAVAGFLISKQIIGRTVVLSVTCGVGIIGTEGFGLPGPIVVGTYMMMSWPRGPNYEIIRQTWTLSVAVAFMISALAAIYNRWRTRKGNTI